MTQSKSLIPTDQKQVLFYDDEITAVRLNDGRVFVPVKPICERLGVQWAAQSKRIRRDPVLAEEIMSVSVTDTDIRISGSRRPHTSDMLCLPLDFISGFLFGINATRVNEELRERVIRYQRECYKALAEAFQEGRLTTDTNFDDLLQQASSDVVEAYQIAQAIMKLARNQIMLETRLDDHSIALDDHNRRLETIEADMHQEDRYISEAQATQISQAVKAIAIALGKQTSRNEFGATWGEFYRKFGVSKYRYLPASKFEEALVWLNEFYQGLTGETPF